MWIIRGGPSSRAASPMRSEVGRTALLAAAAADLAAALDCRSMTSVGASMVVGMPSLTGALPSTAAAAEAEAAAMALADRSPREDRACSRPGDCRRLRSPLPRSPPLDLAGASASAGAGGASSLDLRRWARPGYSLATRADRDAETDDRTVRPPVALPRLPAPVPAPAAGLLLRYRSSDPSLTARPPPPPPLLGAVVVPPPPPPVVWLCGAPQRP